VRALRAVFVVVAFGASIAAALGVGVLLNQWRSRGDTSDQAQTLAAPTASAPSRSAAPTPSPVVARITRDDAVNLVRSLGEVARLDRVEARLMPFTELAALGAQQDRTGGPYHGGGIPERVWAVAVSGDLTPNMSDYVPPQHYTWAIYGINADRIQVGSLSVGTNGTWPPGFDRLLDHPAIAPPRPTPTPLPPKFDHLYSGPAPLRASLVRLASGDAHATSLWGVVTTSARDARGTPFTSLMRSDDGGANWRRADGATARPFDVAAMGATVVVSDAGLDTAERGVTTTGGLFASTDAGATWRRVSTDGVMRVQASSYRGRPLFLAEHWYPLSGAATGPSRIFASFDALSWREIGEVPGPASFGALDVPIVSFSKNVPGDGIYRVEGADFATLRLVPITGSPQIWATPLAGPRPNELWVESVNGGAFRHSIDGGRTWTVAGQGLSGRIAGLFIWHGEVYAIGDGAYRWDGASWQVANILTSKARAVFQIGTNVFIQGIDGSFWRSEI
jgi:hypothetical protein